MTKTTSEVYSKIVRYLKRLKRCTRYFCYKHNTYEHQPENHKKIKHMLSILRGPKFWSELGKNAVVFYNTVNVLPLLFFREKYFDLTGDSFSSCLRNNYVNRSRSSEKIQRNYEEIAPGKTRSGKNINSNNFNIAIF